MTGVLHHRIDRACRAWFTLALCTLSFGSAQAARASCGDWLVGHEMAAGQGIHATATAAVTGGSTPGQPAPPAGRPACRGPSCSRSPGTPLAPSSDPTWEPAPSRWACLVATAELVSLRRDGITADDAIFVPTGPCGRIDRPPRLG